MDAFQGNATHPDWSPDGMRIAFIRETPQDRTELWVVDADGTNAEMLVSCDVPCNQLAYPDWAPDGSAIFVAKDANASAEHPPTTFTVDRFDIASREAKTILSREDGSSLEQPRLSPDGTQLVYARFREFPTPGSAIFIAPLAGGGERELSAWDLFGAHPDWSSAGRIVFNTYDLAVFPDTTESANLYSVAVDGTDLRQLTSFGMNDTRATQPRWTPDGSAIVFTRVDGKGWGERRLAYIDADGTGLRWLTPIPVDGTHPQLRPVADH
jgi:Tol biopolymer transport system component